MTNSKTIILTVSLLAAFVVSQVDCIKSFDKFIKQLQDNGKDNGDCDIELIKSEAQRILKRTSRIKVEFSPSFNTCLDNIYSELRQILRSWGEDEITTAYDWINTFKRASNCDSLVASYVQVDKSSSRSLSCELEREQEQEVIMARLLANAKTPLINELEVYNFISDKIVYVCHNINVKANIGSSKKFNLDTRDLINILRAIYHPNSVFKHHKFVEESKRGGTQIEIVYSFHKLVDICSLFRGWYERLTEKTSIMSQIKEQGARYNQVLEVYPDDYYDDENINYEKFYSTIFKLLISKFKPKPK